MRRHGIAAPDPAELARRPDTCTWSPTRPSTPGRWRTREGFWDAVSQDLVLEWFAPYQRVLDTSRGLPWTTWWTGARLNTYRRVLPRRDRWRLRFEQTIRRGVRFVKPQDIDRSSVSC